MLKRSKYYIDIFEQQKPFFEKNNINMFMENDVLRRISMCKGIFQDTIAGKSKFIPEHMGSIPEKRKRQLQRRKVKTKV
jgi:hypothetical protein